MFVAPDGSYTATYPRLRRRVGAGALDWVLCWVIFLVASIVGGILQTVANALLEGDGLVWALGAVLLVVSQLVVAGPLVAYFAYYWTQGSTLGMRALDIELVLDDTGAPPSWWRTVPRSVLAVLIALAVLNVYFAWSDDTLTGFERGLAGGSLVVASLGLAAKAWMLVDERRRSALDHLFGLVYLEEFVFTRTRPSPWTEGFR
jgi:uncharacterized RDD family membrane protein YckC